MRKITSFLGEKSTNGLEDERRKRDLRLKDVAKDLGIVPQLLNAIEKNRRSISSQLALKIADYYSKPVEYFFVAIRFETRSSKNE
ncbi:helix-turn-helix domain-containing protein [Bacillus mycoides]|uniref:helix-turn-helix domain-containing protein n=1 Tax=Bacillus mycoides TaxID=1405 RepID=UPI003D1C50A2